MKKNRQIVLDTETTGLSPENGDRIVEIGCVELINFVPTNNTYHQYINPDRKMSEGAFRVSGISNAFLLDKPKFEEIYKEFLTYISDSAIVAHNAKFDVGFINSELQKINEQNFITNEIIDTLAIAKRKYPGAQASLDALCKRFEIDITKREKHGALLDANLLVDVYIELIGGKQTSFILSNKSNTFEEKKENKKIYDRRKFEITGKELIEHQKIINKIKKPIWSE
ncbi:MAG: DNA polymerase III subunit epsilon [Rhodospirillaceae bacterium]|nr:DNA polymerase III subunit epsilon [Rhodospirillaceae bacterium]|tara:strand:- start:404 stop:1081 length:678 start_codon:yes stop_codon:yes gene_type:complete